MTPVKDAIPGLRGRQDYRGSAKDLDILLKNLFSEFPLRKGTSKLTENVNNQKAILMIIENIRGFGWFYGFSPLRFPGWNGIVYFI